MLSKHCVSLQNTCVGSVQPLDHQFSTCAHSMQGAVWETQAASLGQEDSLEKEMATHWKIPWMEEPGKLQSMGPQRVRDD